MLAPIITDNLKKINNICKTHNVKKLYVFGSAAREDYQFYSDIDLLVDFNNDEDNEEFSKNYFWFKEELVYAFKKPIDLLFYKKALKSRLKKNIMKEKILLYGRKTN